MSEWTDIGEQLRKARESKGFNLKDVAHTTRIPLATLSALEESDYSIFPSPTYARSFLSQYSEYLDVDAHEWIDAFETGNVLSNVNDHSYLQSHSEHVGDHRHNPAPAKRRARTASRNDEVASGESSRMASVLQTLTVFFVTALLIGGGIYTYKKFEPMLTGSATEETANKSEENTDTSSSATESNTTDKPVQKNTPATTKPPVKAEDESTQKPPLVANNEPPVTTSDTKNTGESQEPVLIKPNRSGPPPKAMVIEEED